MIVSAWFFEKYSRDYNFTCSKCGEKITVYGIWLSDALYHYDQAGWVGEGNKHYCPKCKGEKADVY